MDNLVSTEDGRICFESNTRLASPRSSDDQNFRKDYAEILPASPEAAELILAEVARGNGSKYLDTIDTSATAMIFTTIFYTTTTQNAHDLVALTKITGGYTTSGLSGTVITGHGVTYGQTGFAIGSFVTQNADKSYTASTTSWTIIPPSTWVPIADNNTSAIGAYYTLTLQRSSGYTWNVELLNNIY